MKISKAALEREFMLATLRANASHTAYALPIDHLLGAFNVASYPGISCDIWAVLMGYEVEGDNAEAPAVAVAGAVPPPNDCAGKPNVKEKGER